MEAPTVCCFTGLLLPVSTFTPHNDLLRACGVSLQGGKTEALRGTRAEGWHAAERKWDILRGLNQRLCREHERTDTKTDIKEEAYPVFLRHSVHLGDREASRTPLRGSSSAALLCLSLPLGDQWPV